MSILYNSPSKKSNPHRAQFARQMMLEEFGYQYGRAIDQGDFVDREPGDDYLNEPLHRLAWYRQGLDLWKAGGCAEPMPQPRQYGLRLPDMQEAEIWLGGGR